MYIIEITQPSKGTTFYRNGHGICEKDLGKATRFNGHYEAAIHLARFLADTVLHDLVEIRIVPASTFFDTWTFEEFLAREG